MERAKAFEVAPRLFQRDARADDFDDIRAGDQLIDEGLGNPAHASTAGAPFVGCRTGGRLFVGQRGADTGIDLTHVGAAGGLRLQRRHDFPDVVQTASADLVDRVTRLPDGHEDVLAFSLMMIRLASCLTCDLDSYRASLGCCTCARRTVVGFKGSDRDMIDLFEEAREEVRKFLASDQLSDALTELVIQPDSVREKG